MTDTIYRVQDATGRGPYRPGLSGAWVDADHDRRNPAITQEFTLRIIQSFPRDASAGCGFFSVAALATWFSVAEQKRLDALGFRVAAIEGATVYAVGDLQILAWRRIAFRYCRWIPWVQVAACFRTDLNRGERLSSNGRKGRQRRHGDPGSAASPRGMEAGAADPD